MKITDFSWLLGGVLLNSFAQLGLKVATRETGAIVGTPRALFTAALQLATSLAFWLALAAYAVSVFVWIVGLSRVPVSQAYPVLSIGYIVTALAAWLILGESLGVERWTGITLIVAGVFFLVRST